MGATGTGRRGRDKAAAPDQFAGGKMVLLVAHQRFGQDILLVDGHEVV